jgi:hypothetical protein
MICGQLDPSAGYPAIEGTHPGDAKRARGIFETLRIMESDIRLGGWLSWVRLNLQKTWDEALAGHHPRSRLDSGLIDKLDRWLHQVLDAFESDSIHNIRYQNASWQRARTLAKHMASEHAPETKLGSQDTVRGLLNAAWICRIQNAENPDRVRAISDRAMAWCRELIRMRGRVNGRSR